MFGVGTDAYRVNGDAFFGGQACGSQGIDFATIVGTVSHQYQYAALRRTLAQALDRQANGVADGGLWSGDVLLRLIQPCMHGLPVEGQRRLQVGAAAE